MLEQKLRGKKDILYPSQIMWKSEREERYTKNVEIWIKYVIFGIKARHPRFVNKTLCYISYTKNYSRRKGCISEWRYISDWRLLFQDCVECIFCYLFILHTEECQVQQLKHRLEKVVCIWKIFYNMKYKLLYTKKNCDFFCVKVRVCILFCDYKHKLIVTPGNPFLFANTNLYSFNLVNCK